MRGPLTKEEQTTRLRIALGEARRFGTELVSAIDRLCASPELQECTVTFNGESVVVTLNWSGDRDGTLVVKVVSVNATDNTIRRPHVATKKVLESALPVVDFYENMLVNGFQFSVRAG